MLTPEQKLDIALSYLTEENQGSYVYPEVIQLETYLTSKGIAKKEHWPIIFHLERGKYVDLFYRQPESKNRGEQPTQIKVTYRGIKFIDKGGFEKLLNKEKRKERLETVVKTISILTFILGIGTFTMLYIKNSEPTIIKLPDEYTTSLKKLEKRIDSLSKPKSNGVKK